MSNRMKRRTWNQHWPLPAAVEAVIDAFARELRIRLGDHMTSLMVHGSATQHDFAPAWSDIDFAVELARAPSRAYLREVRSVHAALFDRFVTGRESGWQSKQLLDGVYAHGWGDNERTIHVSGTNVWMAEGNPLPGCRRLTLSRHGVCVLGRPVSVRPPAYEKPTAMFDWLVEELRGDPSRHSPIMKVGLIQECARAICYASAKTCIGKGRALRHLLESRDGLASAWETGLTARARGSDYAIEHAADISRIFDAFAPIAFQRVSSSLARLPSQNTHE